MECSSTSQPPLISNAGMTTVNEFAQCALIVLQMENFCDHQSLRLVARK